ncbi:unnamed protein product [Adineta ricciae]|uniref:histone acetyltransferase n=1 Tax=Adineta ricciae TaxID=249248 RepID=A0A815VCG1_ADIRI|nr:unnamed protein product [Adineta ricciae]CAF1528326.1 unnamed protein product [Adineta ricciae]
MASLIQLDELSTTQTERCTDCDSDKKIESKQDSQVQRQRSMKRCIESLSHAVQCKQTNCINRSCFRYKRVIQHTKHCKGKNSQCNVCKQMIFLCWYHAKHCMKGNCQVPFCTSLKIKIQKQREMHSQKDKSSMEAMIPLESDEDDDMK